MLFLLLRGRLIDFHSSTAHSKLISPYKQTPQEGLPPLPSSFATLESFRPEEHSSPEFSSLSPCVAVMQPLIVIGRSKSGVEVE